MCHSTCCPEFCPGTGQDSAQNHAGDSGHDSGLDTAQDLVYSLRGLRKTRAESGFCLDLELFEARRGQCLALVGPSGCGKSTALDLLACVLSPDLPAAKESFFRFAPVGGQAIDVLAAWQKGNGLDRLAALRLPHLGYVLQTGGLLPFLTVRQNILLHCSALGTESERGPAIASLLERLGIAHLTGHYPATLSVGERQRVAIARALAHGPALVLADEPTASLDPCSAENVIALLASLASQAGITVIMVSHAPDAAASAGFTLVPFVTSRQGVNVVTTVRHGAS